MIVIRNIVSGAVQAVESIDGGLPEGHSAFEWEVVDGAALPAGAESLGFTVAGGGDLVVPAPPRRRLDTLIDALEAAGVLSAVTIALIRGSDL